ncbi:MAG: hypothetical protein FWG98_06870 [Candidatus Cloacimonetes bacterium]|nr:hypothetical protein [Candidatus Cloacimonadota bacterium]
METLKIQLVDRNDELLDETRYQLDTDDVFVSMSEMVREKVEDTLKEIVRKKVIEMIDNDYKDIVRQTIRDIATEMAANEFKDLLTSRTEKIIKDLYTFEVIGRDTPGGKLLDEIVQSKRDLLSERVDALINKINQQDIRESIIDIISKIIFKEEVNK